MSIRSFYKKILKKKYKIKSPTAAAMLVDDFIMDYKNTKNIIETMYIHSKGYSVNDWKLSSINKNNYKDYLSTAEYYALHPINGKYSSWIDDKLTLKNLLQGTELSTYMPKYYYHIDESGTLLCLYDSEEKKINPNIEDVINLLKNKGSLAIKLLNGSIGEGFYKAEYNQEKFYLNNREYSCTDFSNLIRNLKNYLITEYLYTNERFSKINPTTTNTIRFLAGKLAKSEPLTLLKGFIRFGTQISGTVENYNRGGVLCYYDENGFFKNGNIMKNGENIVIDKHPDTNVDLNGYIPCFDEIKKCVRLFGEIYPQCTYLGFDFVVTNKDEVKIIEINSLTSLDACQLDGPWKAPLCVIKR